MSFSSIHLLSRVWLCHPMDCSTPGFPVHHQPPKLIQTHFYQVGDAIQSSHPLLSHSHPAFNLSQHQVLSNESVLCIRWPKHWSFSISPSNEYSGLISFRIGSPCSPRDSRVFANKYFVTLLLGLVLRPLFFSDAGKFLKSSRKRKESFPAWGHKDNLPGFLLNTKKPCLSYLGLRSIWNLFLCEMWESNLGSHFLVWEISHPILTWRPFPLINNATSEL